MPIQGFVDRPETAGRYVYGPLSRMNTRPTGHDMSSPVPTFLHIDPFLIHFFNTFEGCKRILDHYGRKAQQEKQSAYRYASIYQVETDGGIQKIVCPTKVRRDTLSHRYINDKKNSAGPEMT